MSRAPAALLLLLALNGIALMTGAVLDVGMMIAATFVIQFVLLGLLVFACYRDMGTGRR